MKTETFFKITFNDFNGFIARIIQSIYNGIEQEEILLLMKTGFPTPEKASKWAKNQIKKIN